MIESEESISTPIKSSTSYGRQIVFISLVLIGIVALGLFFKLYIKSNKTTPITSSQTHIPSQKNAITPEITPLTTTSSTQTYENKELGFQFSYPGSYQYSEEPQITLPDNLKTIAIFRIPNSTTKISLYLDHHDFSLPYLKKYAPTGSEDFTPEPHIYNQNTFYYYGPGGGGVSYPDQYFFNLKGKTLYFIFDGPYIDDKTPAQQTKEIEKQLLTSFKLLSRSISQKNTQELKQYTETYVSIQYPASWSVHPQQIFGSSSNTIMKDPAGIYELEILSHVNYNNGTGKPYSDIKEFMGMSYAPQATIIAGNPIYISLGRAGSENIDWAYFFTKDNQFIYTITLTTKANTQQEMEIGQQLFQKITSTIRLYSLDQQKTGIYKTGSIGTIQIVVPDGYAVTSKPFSRSGPNDYCSKAGVDTDCQLLIIKNLYAPTLAQSYPDYAGTIVISSPGQFGILVADAQECFKEQSRTIPFGRSTISVTEFYYNLSQITYHKERIDEGKSPYECSGVTTASENFYALKGCSQEGICVWADKSLGREKFYSLMGQLTITSR